MEIEVTSGVIARLLEEAEKAAPQECCGLLLGNNRIEVVRPAANVADNPLHHFEIDPAALIAAHRDARAGGLPVFGYYHSHPNGHPRPSATDCEHASGDNRVWAIVAGGKVTFWRDGLNGFEALSSGVSDG